VRRGIRGLVFILAGSITLLGCGRPTIVNSSELLSPDLRWTVTLEHVDNGLGFGQGLLYDEVHLSTSKRWRLFWRHGEPDKSAIFYVNSADGYPPKARWIDPQHLLVIYPACNTPGRALTRFESVFVSYETFTVPPGTMWCVNVEAPNKRFERSRAGSFAEPGRESMIWINQLRFSSTQPRVAQPHR
jgi:hypothetical protein